MKTSKFASILAKISVCAFLSTGMLVTEAAVKTESKTNVWPVMVRAEYNPVMKLVFDVKNEPSPVTLGALEIDLTGTTAPTDIAEIELYVEKTEKNKNGKETRTPKKVASAKVTSTKILINAKAELPEGETTFVVSAIMKDKADIDGKLAINVTSATLSGKKIFIKDAKAMQRIGYAIAKRGDIKSKNFRIPGIATSAKTGTLIAVYDIRYNHAGDLPARIDVGFSRSTNGGKTWTPTKVAMSTEGMNGGNGVGDPTILCDSKTGAFWVAALWSPKSGHPIWKSYAGTTSVEKCGQFVIASSSDDGKSWSKIRNITEDVKRLKSSDTSAWGCLFQGPGNGITMQDGTLVFPAQIWGNEGKAPHHGVLVYSKDNGKTWTSSAQMPFGGSESTVVETTPGTLLLNTREGAGWNRMVAETKDLGKTWKKHESMENGKTGLLRQPGGCQASLLAVPNKAGRKIIYFSNPNAGSRKDMTIKFSKDDGKTWSNGLLYDERNCAGYSSLTIADEKHIGVLYEGTPGSETIFFMRIPYTEIIKAK